MKNNQKGFANIVLVGVLVLVIFGGYLLLKNSTPADKEIPASQTTDETASWKTYTNSEYGFEFKYPSDYLRKESSIYFSEEIPEGTKVSVESPTCKTLVTGGGPWPKDCVSYNLLIQKNKISIAAGGVIVIKTATQVAGYPAEKVEDKSGGMWEGLNQIYVQFEKGGDWYISYLSYNSENKIAAENLFYQILSTFKFIK